MAFPSDFVWGAATSAYQIEGAHDADGKGPSIWDVFCRRPGAVWQGNTGEVACDHYHRYREDVGLMRQLGLRGYRLSVGWSRVMPEGIGKVNEAGLAFYDRLVDELLAAGIQPWVTLLHFDDPYALLLKGGWLNRDCAAWFADYAAVLAARLGDRVRHWLTINEPQCLIGLGYTDGSIAPGLKLPPAEALLAGHHVMLGHGLAVQALRAHSPQPCCVGYAPVGVVKMPGTAADADVAAAREAMFGITGTHSWNNTWWMDPVYLGRYPEDGMRLAGADAPPLEPGDLETIAQPLDCFAVNIYNGREIEAGPDGRPRETRRPDGYPLTLFHWPVNESCLYWGPRFLFERYGLPIVITENGMSGIDWIHLDGRVHDPQRIDFLHRHLLELHRAIQDGIPVRGYFVWTLTDNFEWAEGYRQRFGLVHVDFPTQKRTPKDSAWWYKDVIATNGQCLLQ